MQQEENLKLSTIRSSVVLDLKNSLPKPTNGQNISKRIRKLGLSIPDFAFLINRSSGGIYNMCSPAHERYKKGEPNDDILIEIALVYLEKLFEEKKQRIKEKKEQEKERVFKTITDSKLVNTTLEMRDFNIVENKSRVINAINNLSSQGFKKISYVQISELTGLSPQSIAKLRENDKDIDEWFTYTNEVEFDEMQNNLSEIARENKYSQPNVSIKAIETKMKFMKSNQKDKSEDDLKNKNNIWDRLKEINNQSSDEIVIEYDGN